ncbi:hypothetical protein N7493_007770 [Penicillium malachiteum]|uniref:GXWXG domain-containing protein n=1 Tax=Penicillium malachiteum TaxID=1324776 RepID=A0AAD6HID8_9EURO|nr:hypothetical protein N7493_007770 [Penicillium malachiteum]
MTLQLPIFPLEYLQTSPTKRFLSLRNSPGLLNPAYIDEIFQELRPIKPENLMGEWDGFILPTGHPFETELEELNWLGNTFDSTDDIAPLIVPVKGERVPFEEWGSASLCEVKYQGAVSATMIYDERPIMVHYKMVRSNIVAGVIESKLFGKDKRVYIYLKK